MVYEEKLKQESCLRGSANKKVIIKMHFVLNNVEYIFLVAVEQHNECFDVLDNKIIQLIKIRSSYETIMANNRLFSFEGTTFPVAGTDR